MCLLTILAMSGSLAKSANRHSVVFLIPLICSTTKSTTLFADNTEQCNDRRTR